MGVRRARGPHPWGSFGRRDGQTLPGTQRGALRGARPRTPGGAAYFALVVFYDLILHGPAGIVPDYLNSPAKIREFVTDEESFGAFVLTLAMAVYTSVAVLVGLPSGSVADRFRSSSSVVDG